MVERYICSYVLDLDRAENVVIQGSFCCYGDSLFFRVRKMISLIGATAAQYTNVGKSSRFPPPLLNFTLIKRKQCHKGS